MIGSLQLLVDKEAKNKWVIATFHFLFHKIKFHFMYLDRLEIQTKMHWGKINSFFEEPEFSRKKLLERNKKWIMAKMSGRSVAANQVSRETQVYLLHLHLLIVLNATLWRQLQGWMAKTRPLPLKVNLSLKIRLVPSVILSSCDTETSSLTNKFQIQT